MGEPGLLELTAKERKRIKDQERHRRNRADPVMRKLMNDRAEASRKRRLERDPTYHILLGEQKRAANQRARADPVRREIRRKRKREKYATDEEYRRNANRTRVEQCKKRKLEDPEYKKRIYEQAKVCRHARMVRIKDSLPEWIAYLLDNRWRKVLKRGGRYEGLTRTRHDELCFSPCTYCGRIPITGPLPGDVLLSGVDRQDNSKGYSLENSVACCRWCNTAKSDLPLQSFITQMKLIAHHQRTNAFPPAFPMRAVRHPHLAAIRRMYTNAVNQHNKRMVKKNSVAEKRRYELTDDEMEALLTSPCAYCGTIPSITARPFGGVDRVDNNGHYERSNVVPACKTCNRSKLEHSWTDFIEMAKRIAQRH